MGVVTNNGTMRAINGSMLEFRGPVVNNGMLIFISGSTNLYSTFSNTINGVVLNRSSTNNSWVSSTAGKWEITNAWSLGVAPFDELSVFITNAITKTVTIDAVTTNTPCEMTIKTLTLSAPSGSTNTLLISNAGMARPLQVLSNFIADANAAVVVSNSVLVVTNCSSSSCSSLIIGNVGSGNQMTISDWGHVQSVTGYIGYNSSSSNNVVLVTDYRSVGLSPVFRRC
jgi:hypothetical protein